jgi:hypothetical protein
MIIATELPCKIRAIFFASLGFNYVDIENQSGYAEIAAAMAAHYPWQMKLNL